MDPKRAGDVPVVPWSAEGERALDFDQVVVLHGISWDQYVALNNAQGRSPRMAYLDGELEVMTVSDRHELIKTLLARLVEVYALEADVPLIGFGQATQRNKRKKAAAEPDETYRIGKIRKSADLVIEVVHTSGGIRKLEVYRRLGAREVWFWINGRIWVYVLVGEQYEERPSSVALPGIDLRALERILAITEDEDQHTAVRDYQRSLRSRA